jgi:hypothetical protein
VIDLLSCWEIADVWVRVEHTGHQKLADHGINCNLHQCGGHSSSRAAIVSKQRRLMVGSGDGWQGQSADAATGDDIDKEGRVYSLDFSYSLLGKASKNLQTFQVKSDNWTFFSHPLMAA